MNPEDYISRLTDISIKKHELLRDMHYLTLEQGKMINEDEISKLQALIDKKQIRIEQINKLDEEFNVYYLRLKQTLKVKSLDELGSNRISGVKELQDSIGNIMRLLHEISLIESENNKKSTALLNNLGNEMKKMSQTKQIGTVYNPPVNTPPSYFIDKKK